MTPLPGVLLCCSRHQAHRRARLTGVSSVLWCLRGLMGQPFYCSAADSGMKREAMVMAPPTTRDSAVSPCFPGCPASLHRHLPPQSPPSHPLGPSFHSQQQPSCWDCPTILKLQLPATAPSRGPASLSGVCMAVARTV